MHQDAVALGDLTTGGKLLEIGCFGCGLHMHVHAGAIGLPPETPVPDVAAFLKCPQCGAINREPGYPVWARPDARPPKMGASAT